MKDLPFNLDRYFEKTEDTIEVSILKLVPGIPHAVANANRYMWLAYNGKKSRRPPLNVIALGNGDYKVLDGNSTLANASLYDWPSIYVTVISKKEWLHLNSTIKIA